MLKVALGALLLAPFTLHCMPNVAKLESDLNEMSNKIFKDFLNEQKKLYGDPCSNPSLAQSNVKRVVSSLTEVKTSFGWLVKDGAGNTHLYEKKENQNVLSREAMQVVQKNRRLKSVMGLYLSNKKIIYIHANKKKILIFSDRRGLIGGKNLELLHSDH